MNEYIVTCKSYEDLENFYDDMETPGGSLYIPNRSVDLVHRRTISRNTHYMLTEEEAAEIRKDERVIACEQPAKNRGIEPEPYWTQTGDFSKQIGADFAQTDKNWGLYRLVKGDTVSSWGIDQASSPLRRLSNRTISTTASGKNVDVVIVDSHIQPLHPEFAVNVDGTGGSRVNQINWFQYSSALGITTPATYTYQFENSNHGTHVAGTACGNTQGWARDANIYNMSFRDTGSGVTDWTEKLWDYLRYFHNNKAINSATGRRNPTIVNNSWGSSYPTSMVTLDDVYSVTYRGTTTSLSGTTTAQKKTALEARACSIGNSNFKGRVPAQNAAVLADATDAMNDGVILVAAAGNSYWNCEEVGGPDFDNKIDAGFDIYHNRGSSPGDTPGIICVGNISSKKLENKRASSNWGGRVDIWAPGSTIISSVYTHTGSAAVFYTPLLQDPRDSNYYYGLADGTSMASPQITGILACLLEQEPNLTPAEARQHLIENSLPDVHDTGVAANLDPYEGFGDSHNRYAFIPKKRSEDGMTSPAQLHKNRNTSVSGVKYPRVRYQTTS